ncbi:hypothetical protein RhiJN_13029 [Ceratobasidium sp. AG-Ba]|nr:hypothetical protein RhiJN_13029 [Ceratobasidium sp. AG-Ba]
MLDSAGPRSSNGYKAGREVFDIIKDAAFWNSLSVLKVSLEPLAIAANITQDAHTRLDDVLVTMCSLYYTYSSHPSIPESVRLAAGGSLEKRWGKVDSDPFIGTTYLNPCYRHDLFNPNEPGLRTLGLYSILKRLFIRFFPDEELLNGEFLEANQMYAEGRGCFSDESMLVDELKESSRRPGGITLLQVWSNHATGPKSGVQQYAKLAHRLVSITPTSVPCERLFSNMGLTHTKLRNRLSTTGTRKITQLKMDLRSRHIRDGLVAPRSPWRQVHTSRTTKSSVELEDDAESEEIDTSAVIDAMLEDLNADEDIPAELECEAQASASDHYNSSHTPPRIIFRWTRELTLARIFDYCRRKKTTSLT